MNLLILGKTRHPEYVSLSYRGTSRFNPCYCEGLPEDHPANRAFFWFVDEGGELGVVHDLAKARNLVALYKALDPPQSFEIVEAIVGDEPPALSGEFLGFDLSCGFNNSLITTRLRVFKSPADMPEDRSFFHLHRFRANLVKE